MRTEEVLNYLKYCLDLAKKIYKKYGQDQQRICEAIGMLKVCQNIAFALGYTELAMECYKWKNILLKRLTEKN